MIIDDPLVHIVPATEDLVKNYVIPAATADKHSVAAATHVVIKNGRIIGYLSVNALPTVLMWLSTIECKVRDTVTVMNFIENFLAGQGHSRVIIPCQATSPLYEYIDRAAKSGKLGIHKTNIDSAYVQVLNDFALKGTQWEPLIPAAQ